MTEENTDTASILDNAEAVIAAFGGIRPMAKKLGVAVTTVQGWKERGAIPFARLDEIREAARREGIDLADLPESAGEDQDIEGGAAAPEKPEQTPPPAEAVDAEKVEPKPEIGVSEAEAAPPEPETIEATAERAPAEQAQESRRSGGFGWGFGLGLALVIGAAAGYFLPPLIKPPMPSAGGLSPADRAALDKRFADAAAARTGLRNAIDPLAARIETLNKELAAIRTSLAAANKAIDDIRKQASTPGAAAAAIRTLSQRIDKLDTALKSVPDAAPLRADIKAMREQLTALAGRVGAVEQRPAAPATDPAVARQLQTLAADLQAARQALAAQKATIEALEKKLAAIPATAGGAAPLVLAVGQLRQAVLAHGAYAGALDAVAALAGSRAEWTAPLAALKPHAAGGVKSVATLRESFDRLTVPMLRAARIAEGDGWLARTWARIRSTISVRRTGGNVAGDGAEAVIARAEAALKDGDLAAAVAQVGKLPPAARQKAAGWLAAARARLAVDAALSTLNRLAVSLIAPAPAAPEEPKQ